MTSEQQRHRVLGGSSRARLLAVLRRAAGPMGVRELAEAVALHPNTTREHLDQLVGAGLAVRETSQPTGRGRPALRYRADPAGMENPRAYVALARVLASELTERSDGRTAAIRAGERWGATMAAGPAVSKEGDAVERLVELLDDVGFAPEAPPADGPLQTIRLRRCPFATLARERGEIVCGTHLGLMRGALRQLRAPLDAVDLEPWVEPDLCVAHLAPAAASTL